MDSSTGAEVLEVSNGPRSRKVQVAVTAGPCR
jgi:hypothetical protein